MKIIRLRDKNAEASNERANDQHAKPRNLTERNRQQNASTRRMHGEMRKVLSEKTEKGTSITLTPYFLWSQESESN